MARHYCGAESERIMQKSKQAYRINIKNPVYAEVLTDTDSGTTYGTVKSLGEAQNAGVTATVATGQLYGDGAIVDSSSVLTGLTLALDVTKIPVEARADIYNIEVEDGVLKEEGGKNAKYIAIGYEVEQTDGSSEYVWLLKGRPQPLSSSVAQSEGNITYSTDSMAVDFVKRKSDNMLRYFADSANADFSESQAAAWFTTGPSDIPHAS